MFMINFKLISRSCHWIWRKCTYLKKFLPFFWWSCSIFLQIMKSLSLSLFFIHCYLIRPRSHYRLGMIWIAHFNSHFKHSLEALVYSHEKVACIVITQNIKCFLEERNFRSIFLDEEKKIILNFFSSLIS